MNTIVIGSLNTDLVATGIKRFPKTGEHVYAKELHIGPGGKSRNIADMMARLTPANSIAMVGKTVRDTYGFWEQPVKALQKAGVNTDYVRILDAAQTQKLPAIALIPVDEEGNNQIIVLPGISDDFDSKDIDKASPLFKHVGANKGMLVLTLECPIETVVYAVNQAKKNDLRVMLDPGGIQEDDKLDALLAAGIDVIKPNEHEARMLTGVEVKDFESAKLAAAKLQELGVERIIITHGDKGAYVFDKGVQKHIPVKNVEAGKQKDATGCGDETMAALCAFMQGSKSFEEAAELAILAGTLQFHKVGIQPLTKEEIMEAAK